MRTENSIKNIIIGITTQIVMALLGFISRKVFIDSLGVEYLGVNGLLTNVLSMLALVESGIGASIVYQLYKPLAENDKPRIIALVQLFKKAYTVLAFIILILSISLFPFLGLLMKDSGTVSFITISYFIFVANTMLSYFNAHKVSLINADQNGYVLARINLGFSIITTITRIIVLLLTANYILYLLIELGIGIIQTIFNGRVVDKRYAYIKTKEKYTINIEEKESLITNIKAMFLHNIGRFCVLGTDNILISAFINVATVGLYSNYTMIINQLAALVNPLIGGIGASIGNLIATESNKKKYFIFNISYLVNFWIYSVCIIFLYVLLQPFIIWWLGDGYLLDNLTFILILVNFYLMGLRSSISTFKHNAGIFVKDKYIPLLEAAINLVASLILVQYLGLAGIFLGTTISTLTTVFWIVPRLTYKYVFDKPLWPYFSKYIFYTFLTLVVCYITLFVCNNLVIDNSFLSLIVKGLVCLIIPNIIYFLIFYRSQEFQYIWKLVTSNLKIRIALIRNRAM